MFKTEWPTFSFCSSLKEALGISVRNGPGAMALTVTPRKTQKENSISDTWEKWGRHIWEKRGTPRKTQKENSISDTWEKWGRHIWEKMGSDASTHLDR